MAVTFYNKGIPVKLINISAWGILWIVSSDPKVKSISDLKGEEIAMPYRTDMPDLVFQSPALKQNLDPATDFKLSYKTNNPTFAREVISGKVGKTRPAGRTAGLDCADEIRQHAGQSA